MKVVFLGTSGGQPTPRRSLPAVALHHEGEIILLDCGEGTQTQIMRKGLGFGRITKIVVTHIHGDHLSGLMGLLMTFSLLERETPITIYGPSELASFYKSMERDIRLHTKFQVTVLPLKAGVFDRGEDYHLEAFPLMHSAPCFGVALQEKLRPGRFNLERARELGVPEGPMFGMLQRGEDVVLEDGRVVSPADVLGAPRAGRRVVYVTDTLYYPGVVPFCRNADLLIHEAMFSADMEHEAKMRKHSTSVQAATIAKDAEAKRLVMTHISARYIDTTPLRDEARAVFPASDVARDLMEIDVPYED